MLGELCVCILILAVAPSVHLCISLLDRRSTKDIPYVSVRGERLNRNIGSLLSYPGCWACLQVRGPRSLKPENQGPYSPKPLTLVVEPNTAVP